LPKQLDRPDSEPWPQLRLQTHRHGSVWRTWQWAQVWQELAAGAQPPSGQDVEQARPASPLLSASLPHTIVGFSASVRCWEITVGPGAIEISDQYCSDLLSACVLVSPLSGELAPLRVPPVAAPDRGKDIGIARRMAMRLSRSWEDRYWHD
jgi:hypothetical protein